MSCDSVLTEQSYLGLSIMYLESRYMVPVQCVCELTTQQLTITIHTQYILYTRAPLRMTTLTSDTTQAASRRVRHVCFVSPQFFQLSIGAFILRPSSSFFRLKQQQQSQLVPSLNICLSRKKSHIIFLSFFLKLCIIMGFIQKGILSIFRNGKVKLKTYHNYSLFFSFQEIKNKSKMSNYDSYLKTF